MECSGDVLPIEEVRLNPHTAAILVSCNVCNARRKLAQQMRRGGKAEERDGDVSVGRMRFSSDSFRQICQKGLQVQSRTQHIQTNHICS